MINRSTPKAKDDALRRYTQSVIMLWQNMQAFLPQCKLFVLCSQQSLGTLSTGIDKFINQQAQSQPFRKYCPDTTARRAARNKINTTLELVMRKHDDMGGNTEALEAFKPRFTGTWKDYARTLFVPLGTVFINNSEWAFNQNEHAIQVSGQTTGVVAYTKAGADKVWTEYLKYIGGPRFPYELNGKPNMHMLLQEVATTQKATRLDPHHERILFYEQDHVAEMDKRPKEATIVCFENPVNHKNLPRSGIVGKALDRSSTVKKGRG